jgi:hypothetical protein
MLPKSVKAGVSKLNRYLQECSHLMSPVLSLLQGFFGSQAGHRTMTGVRR